MDMDLLLDEQEEDEEDTGDEEELVLNAIRNDGGEQREKVEGFVEVTVPAMTATQFKENFRLNRPTVARVVEVLGEGVQEQPLSLEFQLLLMLYYVGSIISFRKVSVVFGVSVSTAWECVHNVVGLLSRLCGRYVRFASLIVLQDTMTDFHRQTGINGIIGAVDGCHIPIQRPTEHEYAYVNRKGFHSINLMAVCDANGKFLDVCIGWPGSVHDARVWKNSPLGIRLEDEQFRRQILPRGGFIIGDSAFQLQPWLMTPFRSNQMAQNNDRPDHTPAQKRIYNKKLSSARVVIEHAFGLLKARFRRLTNLETKSVKKAVDITTAVCVLHNICVAGDDTWPELEEAAKVEDEQADGVAGAAVAPEAASARRHALVEEILMQR